MNALSMQNTHMWLNIKGTVVPVKVDYKLKTQYLTR